MSSRTSPDDLVQQRGLTLGAVNVKLRAIDATSSGREFVFSVAGRARIAARRVRSVPILCLTWHSALLQSVDRG